MSPPVVVDGLDTRRDQVDGDLLDLGELVGLAFDEGVALLVMEERDDRREETAVLFGLQQGLPGASPQGHTGHETLGPIASYEPAIRPLPEQSFIVIGLVLDQTQNFCSTATCIMTKAPDRLPEAQWT
jgi:hypothetical protein